MDRAMSDAAAIPAAEPLAGVIVVEMGHSVAAPFGGQILADLGATVVKIEKPDVGDDARRWGPPFWEGAAAVFQSLNRNKLSAVVDLKNDTECAKLRLFLETRADVVLQNMRPGLVGKLGLGASLRARNKRLIYCNLGAFGAKGPLAGRPGYDPLMQAFGGIMSVTGEDGRPPVRVGPALIDMGSGMWSAIGILAALRRREVTGEGCEVDTSLYETALAWVGSHTAMYFATGEAPGRIGSENPTLAPYKVFEASDHYVLIAAGNDNLFRKLADAFDHPEWAADARYATNAERVARRAEVNAMVQAVVATRARDEWVAILEQAGVPCAPLQSIDEIVDHPQTRALGMMQNTPDGTMRLMGLPVSFDGERPRTRSKPPALGDATGFVLGGPAKDPAKD
jgi:crotonobetainyl-CoA:carnitine CoA-transferase CaiB-like acyl-CoA transferase